MDLPIGRLPHGPRNRISDVPGVRVGHCTVDAGDCHTGVTVVMPPCPNPFLDKSETESGNYNESHNYSSTVYPTLCL